MARRRTFTNMRVRGTLQVDTLLVNRGVAVASHKTYLATLNYDSFPDTLTVSEGLNQFGPINWERLGVGQWAHIFPVKYSFDRFFCSPLQPFFDHDAELIIPTLSYGHSFNLPTSSVAIGFQRLDGSSTDPASWAFTVHFQLFE